MDLTEFRKSYPQYDDMSDKDLALALHENYYSDIPVETFFNDVGIGDLVTGPPSPTGGAVGLEKMSADGAGVVPFTPGKEAPENPAGRAYIDTVKTAIQEIPGAVTSAIKNVPERLAIGAEGLALGAAESAEERASGEIDETYAAMADRARYDVITKEIADLYAKMEAADPKDHAGIRAEIDGLLREKNELNVTGVPVKDSLETISSARERGREAWLAIEENRRSLVPIDAPEGSPAWYIAQAIGASAEMAPALAVSALTRNPAPAMAFMAGFSGGHAYIEGRETGLNPEEARGFATLTALSEGIPEALPVSAIIKPGFGFMTRIAAGAAAEGAQEMVTEALQIGLDKGILNEDMTWGEARKRIMDAGIIGTLAGGVLGGGVSAIETASRFGAGVVAEPINDMGARIRDAIVARGMPDPLVPAPEPEEGVPGPEPLPPAPEMPPAPPVVSGAPAIGAPPVAGSSEDGSATQPYEHNVLAFIRDLESANNYDRVWSGIAKADAPPKPITTMTINEVLAWQDSIDARYRSEAAGAYQIMEDTLRGLVKSLGLTGSEVFDGSMQDRLAIELMRGRGLDKFMAGEISAETFADNLSKEWAALPMATGPKAGRSAYDGDGINSAGTTLEDFMQIVTGGAYTASGTSTGHGASGQSQQQPEDAAEPSVTQQAPQDQQIEETSQESTQADPSEQAAATDERNQEETNVADDTDVPDVPTPEAPRVIEETEAAPEQVTQAAEQAEEPTSEAQKEAGNYKKGHVKIEGLNITIENPKGSVRSGISENGEKWSTEMPAHYGYIKRTKGKDGDHVNLYIGDAPKYTSVFIVDQIDPDTRAFDEHKAIIGVPGMKEARELYKAGFSDGSGAKRMGEIRKVSMEDFKAWLRDGSQNRPFGTRVAERAKKIAEAKSEIRKARKALSDAKGEEAKRLLRVIEGQSKKLINLVGKKEAAKLIGEENKAEKSGGKSEPRTDPKNAEADTGKKKPKPKKAEKPTTTRPKNARGRSLPPRPKPRRTRLKLDRKAIELARKTTIEKLKAAAREIEAKMKVDDHSYVQVTVHTPSGEKTTYTLMATRAGRDTALRLVKEWKSKPAEVLALDPPLAVDALMDMPMPNWKPLWRNIETPARPGEGKINVAGEEVSLPAIDNPVRRARIRLAAERLMGQRVYQGKVKGKSTLGFYRQTNGELRLSQFDDIEVLAHEMAHWLDFNSTNEGRFNSARKSAPKKAKNQMKNLSYTSHPALVSKEGFAEFVRLWLTQYDVAVQAAPDFVKVFEKALASDPKMEKGLKHLRREMHKYFLQGDLAQANSNIGQDESKGAAIERFLSKRPAERARQQAIDSLHGFRVVERHVRGGITSAEVSPTKLFQMVNGAEGVFEAAFHQGSLKLGTDGSIEMAGPSLADAVRPIVKQGAKAWDDFMLYSAARRAKELLGQGRENLFTPSQVESMLALETPEFVKAFDKYQQFNREMLDFYVQMGLLTKKQRAAFTKANQSYFPFHRMVESLETGNAKGGQSITKRLTGGTHNTRDLSENFVYSIFSNVRQAMIARAKSALYETVIKNDKGSAFAVPLAPDSKLVKEHIEEMTKKVAIAMADLGFGISDKGAIIANPYDEIITDTSEIEMALKRNPALLEVWMHNQPPRTKETMIDSAIIRGRRRYFEIIDPVLAESLLSLQVQDHPFWHRVGTAIRRIRTRTITNMPVFYLTNFTRDTTTAATLSDTGFKPIYDSLKGLGHIIGRTETYRDWQRQGGGYATMVHALTSTSRKRVRLDVPTHTLLDAAAKVLASWDAISAAFENATRVGEFAKAIEKGETKTEAAFRSREISTDFMKRAGSKGWAELLDVMMFANPALQGNDRLLRAFIGPDGRIKGGRVGMYALKRAFLGFGTVLATFTAALWAINHDDERYQRLTKDQKARFWHIWLPGREQALRIPKPYGAGFIFADTVESALDYVKDRDGKALAENLAFSFKMHFWFLDYPAAIQPFLDHQRNETFTGAPVIPAAVEGASPHMQFTPNTPLLYREFGKRTGWSPVLAHHYTRSYLGYLERMFSDMSEKLLWDKDRYGPQPFPKPAADYLLYQFHEGPVPYRTKYTEEYYSLRQRAHRAATDIRLAREAVRRGDVEYEAVMRDDMTLTLNGIGKAISTIDSILSDGSDVMIAVKFNKNMARAEKEAKIEAWYKQKDELLSETIAKLETMIEEAERAGR